MNKAILALVAIIVIGGIVYWALTNPGGSTDNPAVINQMPVVTSGENPQPGGIHDMPVEPAAAMARKDLAAKLSIDEKSIVIMQITEETWSDSCLGLGGPAESCLQALVPGFKVEMLTKGVTYVYRTDATGASVRAETN
jgi:hypothetical protein